jgi:hypothetical protein
MQYTTIFGKSNVGIDLNDRRPLSQTLWFFLLTPSKHSLLASLTGRKHKHLGTHT